MKFVSFKLFPKISSPASYPLNTNFNAFIKDFVCIKSRYGAAPTAGSLHSDEACLPSLWAVTSILTDACSMGFKSFSSVNSILSKNSLNSGIEYNSCILAPIKQDTPKFTNPIRFSKRILYGSSLPPPIWTCKGVGFCGCGNKSPAILRHCVIKNTRPKKSGNDMVVKWSP